MRKAFRLFIERLSPKNPQASGPVDSSDVDYDWQGRPSLRGESWCQAIARGSVIVVPVVVVIVTVVGAMVVNRSWMNWRRRMPVSRVGLCYFGVMVLGCVMEIHTNRGCILSPAVGRLRSIYPRVSLAIHVLMSAIVIINLVTRVVHIVILHDYRPGNRRSIARAFRSGVTTG